MLRNVFIRVLQTNLLCVEGEQLWSFQRVPIRSCSGQAKKEVRDAVIGIAIGHFSQEGPVSERSELVTQWKVWLRGVDLNSSPALIPCKLFYVVDLRTNKVLKAIPGVPGVEGVEFVPELKKVYTSDAGDNTIGIIAEWRLTPSTGELWHVKETN